jgi:hypothetical protein
MNQIQLRRAAIRTLRAGIIRKYPPGERRDTPLGRLEVTIERSARHTLHATAVSHKADSNQPAQQQPRCGGNRNGRNGRKQVPIVVPSATVYSVGDNLS